MKLIVTSRAALRLRRWEYEFQLTPLALPDPCLAQSCETLERVPSVAPIRRTWAGAAARFQHY
ncbi:MAG: hypothetical protein JO057_21690 [Chloroflexi bacterium]|nr:hypothetical protein [Chloroflexota bacterium]